MRFGKVWRDFRDFQFIAMVSDNNVISSFDGVNKKVVE